MWFLIVHADNLRLSQEVWEGFFVEGLQRSWEMALRGLDPEMIANLHDIMERNFSKMSSQLDASLVDRDKEVDQFETSSAKNRIRKAFYRCLWC